MNISHHGRDFHQTPHIETDIDYYSEVLRLGQ